MEEFNDIDNYIDSLFKHKCLSEYTIKNLCALAIDILSKEPNVVFVQAPVTLCGDIHGHYRDLLEVFKIGGYIPNTNYLFLGNYVSKGNSSIEVITLLLCYKIRWSSRITLLRGGHENINATLKSGFYDECKYKYGNENVWKYICEVFNYMPVCALINEQVFCVHSGLSPGIEKIEQIQILDRIKDTPSDGPLGDFMWAQPDQYIGWFHRTPTTLFGIDVTYKFLEMNNISMIVRAHDALKEGYRWLHDNKLITLSLSYNWAGHKSAAILEISEHLELKLIIFTVSNRNPICAVDFPDYFS